MAESANSIGSKTLRGEYIYKAKLAEQAERYDEMADAMKYLVSNCFHGNNDELSVEERNLLSVAYKNAVGSRRASWRIISSLEQKEQNMSNLQCRGVASEYRKLVEDELNQICQDILDLLSNQLIPHTKDCESIVFYYKMKGDYYRYISEFSAEQYKKAAGESAEESYQQATEVAEADLPPTHPIRLGLALNYSVFYYEIMEQPHRACEMAKQAFDDAITEFDNVSEDSYKDSTLIMQLLRDNLTLWTSDVQADTKPLHNDGSNGPAPHPATTAALSGEDSMDDTDQVENIDDPSRASSVSGKKEVDFD